MSASGQSRQFDGGPATSGPLRSTDINRPAELVRFVPISEVNDSFDHLVGKRQRCRGNGNAKRFRGFEIDHEGKLARLFDRRRILVQRPSTLIVRTGVLITLNLG